MTEAIKDRDYCKEAFDVNLEYFNEMGRTHEAELATLCTKLA